METDWKKQAVFITTGHRDGEHGEREDYSRITPLKSLLLTLPPQQYFTEKPEELVYKKNQYPSGLIGKTDKGYSESFFNLNDNFTTLECTIWLKGKNASTVKFLSDERIVINNVKLDSLNSLAKIRSRWTSPVSTSWPFASKVPSSSPTRSLPGSATPILQIQPCSKVYGGLMAKNRSSI